MTTEEKPDPTRMHLWDLMAEIKQLPPRKTVDELAGIRLKMMREARGLSQRDLAVPGVSYAYISRIEAGTRTPSKKALELLALQLGVAPRQIAWGIYDPIEADNWVNKAFAHLPPGDFRRLCLLYGQIRRRNAEEGISGILRVAT